MNKEQALKRIDELEEKLGGKVKALQGEVKELMSANKDITDLAVKAESERDEANRKLQGFNDLAKALGKIKSEPSVDMVLLRSIIKDELSAMGDPMQIGEARLESVKRVLDVKEVKKDASYSDESIGGKALSVIAHGAKGKRWKVTDVGEEIARKWGGVLGKSLGIELGRLAQEDGILGRVDDGHSHFLYFLPENVVLKEK